MRHGRKALLLVGMGLGLASCGGSGEECLALPCPIPLAIEVRVSAADGGSVDGVVVHVTGAATGTASCTGGANASTCYVPGVAGTYNLEVAARGLQTTQRTVTVGGTTPECGCPTVVRAQLDVALDRNP